jgi:hypothetical protein
MPERMQDQYIRVYCKQRDSDVLEALRTAFTQWCSLNRCVPPHSAGEMTPSHTPQKSHQQTSPRVSAAGPRVLNEVSCTLLCPFSLDSSPPKEKAKMQMWRHCLYKIGTGRSIFFVPTLLSLSLLLAGRRADGQTRKGGVRCKANGSTEHCNFNSLQLEALRKKEMLLLNDVRWRWRWDGVETWR